MELTQVLIIFLLLGITQGFFLCVLLLTRRENAAAVVVFYFLPFYLKSGPEKIVFVEALMRDGAPLDVEIIEWLKLPHGAAYTLGTFGVLRRYRRRLEESFSNLDRLNLGWLRNILTGTMVVWVVAIVSSGLTAMGIRFLDSGLGFAPLALVVFVYVIGILGLPDERCGESVKSFVVLKEGSGITAKELRDYCKTQLAPYKAPRQIEFLDELPKSSMMKILRCDLREREMQKEAGP